jgi:hypothetical protein
VPDNSNADKDSDDEYEQEDLHVTAEELRDLWRSVRGGQGIATPLMPSAMDEPRSSSPAQEADAFPPVSSPPPTPSSLRARRNALSYSASLPPDEDTFPQFAAPEVSRTGRNLSQRRSLSAQTHFLPESTPSGNFSAERLNNWANIRRHSRWFLPTVLVLLSFIWVSFASLDGGTRLPPQAIGPMFLIFTAIGILQSGALYYADANANDTAWVLAVAGGIIAFLATICFVLFSTSFAFFLTILLLLVGCLLLRRYSCVVKAGTAAVMGRFGKPTRALHAGFNLRSPGERVLGYVDTGPKRYEIPLVLLRLRSGEQVKLRVSVLYEVIPGQEYLAIRNTKNWNTPIQQSLARAVEEVISRLTADDFIAASAGVQVGPSLSHTLDTGAMDMSLSDLDNQVRNALHARVAGRGVEIQTVRVHLVDGPRSQAGGRPASLTTRIVSSAEGPHPTLLLPADQTGVGRVVEGSGQALPHLIAPPPMITHVAGMATSYTDGRQANAPEERTSLFSEQGTGKSLSLVPPSGMGVRFSGANPAPPLLSLRQLEQFYNDIVQQQITDSSTIRRIIAQFEGVAADQVLSDQAEFDATAAARNLRKHLTSLERQASAPQTFSSDASSPPPPQAR